MQPSAHTSSAISMSVHDAGLNNAYGLAGDEQRSTDGNGGSPERDRSSPRVQE